MQDAYVGDIGDYGKYGLLRSVSKTSLRLAINWYRVDPIGASKQNDGKFVKYLTQPELYWKYDPELFDELVRIVLVERQRKIERVEMIDLGVDAFFSEKISQRRELWHSRGLSKTENADIVFLDPDNGLATKKMMENSSYSEKHVSWSELKDYYDRGQSVILYQHRPQMTKGKAVIDAMIEFDQSYLAADHRFGIEFTPWQNRYYFFFCHKEHANEIKKVVTYMSLNWQGMCKPIEIQQKRTGIKIFSALRNFFCQTSV